MHYISASAVWRVNESAGKCLQNFLQINREKRAINAITNVSNVNTVFTCASGTHLGGDPVAIVNAAMDYVQSTEGIRPNLVAFGVAAWNTFAVNSHVIFRNKGVPTTETAGEMFRAKVVLSQGYCSTATYPQSVAPFLNDSIFCCIAPPADEGLIFSPIWGLTPTWTPRGTPGPYVAEILPYDDPIRKSTAVEVGVYETEVVVDPKLGVLITGTSSSQVGGI